MQQVQSFRVRAHRSLRLAWLAEAHFGAELEAARALTTEALGFAQTDNERGNWFSSTHSRANWPDFNQPWLNTIG